MKLFCIPYAGGNENSYKDWNPGNGIEVIPMKLRGRSNHLMEKPYSTLREAAEDCFLQIMEQIDGEPYAIFGHSMGGAIAYELYSVIRDSYAQMPEVIFLSGVNAPTLKYKGIKVDYIDDDELIRYMVKLGSVPKEYSGNMIIRNFVQTFRNDLTIFEEYNKQEHTTKLQCDVVVICAKSDSEVSVLRAGRWKRFTSGGYKFYKVSGNHFYFMDRTDELFDILEENIGINDESGRIKEKDIRMAFKRFSLAE